VDTVTPVSKSKIFVKLLYVCISAFKQTDERFLNLCSEVVIMLGLGSLSLIYQMFIVLFIFGIWFVLMEKSYYFNLIWLLKYRYYKVQDEIGNTYIIYSKRNDVKEVGEIQNLVRINNFTFLEKE